MAATALERLGVRALDNYDPRHGLRVIAGAEALEGHYRRARDVTRLFEAVEMKLAEQRAFVRWYDAQPKDQGAAMKRADRSVSTFVSLAAIFGLDPKDGRGINAAEARVSRWRRALSSDESFSEALADAQQRCLRVCELEPVCTIRGTEGTGEFERNTPAEYIASARSVLGGIDLDPASNAQAQRIVKAARYFTIKDDGLAHPWRGRVWLNPPYHRGLLPAFVDKLVGEVEAGRVVAAVMLTNNCTDTAWFARAQATAAAICFTTGRISFLEPGGRELGAPPSGQTFFYFGPDVARFAEVFCRIGFLVRPWRHGGCT